MPKKTVMSGGHIVLPDRVVKASLVLEGEKIAGMCTGLPFGDYDVIDVSGKYLMPGVIDSHVHMWDPSPMNYREDWRCGSMAAVSGGITTIVEMPLSVPPVVDRAGFVKKKETASRESVADFALWGGLIPSCIGNLRELDELGCVAYKGFLSFANPDYPQITDGYLVEAMREAAAFGGLIGVHAENAEAAEFGVQRMIANGEMDEARYDEARPWWVEVEAIQRAALFARACGCRLYICHMSSFQGAELLRREKERGLEVTVETCPHYLIFDNTYLREKKAFAKCNPPLRDSKNVEKLWDALFAGDIDVIGSDHGPYTDQEKQREGCFWKEHSGFGGFDAMLPAMLTEGYWKRGLPLWRLAGLMSGNAASAFGLDDRKGSLLPGADADIVVLNLNKEWRFDGTRSLSKTKTANHVYQDREMKGIVERTYVRGTLVYDRGVVKVPGGHGTYIEKRRKNR